MIKKGSQLKYNYLKCHKKYPIFTFFDIVFSANKPNKKRKFVELNTTVTDNQNQIQISNEPGPLDQYFSDFQVNTRLNRSGITKTKGASPRTIFKALFKPAFYKANLYQCIVQNKDARIDSDAAYRFLNSFSPAAMCRSALIWRVIPSIPSTTGESNLYSFPGKGNRMALAKMQQLNGFAERTRQAMRALVIRHAFTQFGSPNTSNVVLEA